MKVHILDKLELFGEMARYAFLFTENNQIDTSKKLVIFGAGEAGYTLNAILKNMNIGATAFFDNDSKKVEGKLSGIKVLSPRLIKENPHDYYIIIAVYDTYDYFDLIKKQLLNYGVSKDSIAFYTRRYTTDFDKFWDYEFMNAVLDSFSDAYYGVPLTEIKLPSPGLIHWVGTAIETSKNLCKWITCDNKENKKTKMLDIGPGMGIQSIALSKLLNLDITWIDVQSYDNVPREYKDANWDHLKEKVGINLVEGDIETIEYSFTETFDVIMFSHVIEHFQYHPVKTMEKMLSWLKPTGKLYLGMPDGNVRGEKKWRFFDSWREMPRYDADNPLKISSNHSMHQFEYIYEEAVDLFNELNLTIERFTRNHNGGGLEFTLSKKPETTLLLQ